MTYQLPWNLPKVASIDTLYVGQKYTMVTAGSFPDSFVATITKLRGNVVELRTPLGDEVGSRSDIFSARRCYDL